MSYHITWEYELVSIEYSGDVTNSEIEAAHFEISRSSRFYRCKLLLLNLEKCNLSSVSIPDLFTVIANDLGASVSNKALKVFMITDNDTSRTKAEQYIAQNKELGTPWEFLIMDSLDDVTPYLNL